MQNPSPNPSPDSSSSSHFAFAHYNISTSAVQPLTIHTPQHTQSRVDFHQRQYRNSNQSTPGLYTRGVDTLNCSSPNRASRRAYVLGRTVTERPKTVFRFLAKIARPLTFQTIENSGLISPTGTNTET